MAILISLFFLKIHVNLFYNKKLEFSFHERKCLTTFHLVAVHLITLIRWMPHRQTQSTGLENSNRKMLVCGAEQRISWKIVFGWSRVSYQSALAQQYQYLLKEGTHKKIKLQFFSIEFSAFQSRRLVQTQYTERVFIKCW